MLGKILKALVAPITAGKKVLGPIITAVGIATGQYWLASIGVSMTVGAYFGPGTPKTQLSRLNISLDPTAPRKAVFGTTAMPLDLRYHEASGTDQEYIEYVIAVASHEVKDITEIWFEEKKAWDSTSGVTATYSGYLSNVTIRKVGTSANTVSVAGGTIWGSDDRLTGCAYVYFKIKRTGADKKSQSPLVNGIPSRITIRGDGALLYDPRKDSTVTGGSGTHRADDQTTWGSYTAADDTDNPALQLLWWLLGWKINGKLSIGCGVPPERIDLPSFIAAANICDENIALAGGGTQKRYQTSGTASDADDRMDIISTFLTCMNGSLRDENGKLALTVIKNDLSSYVLDLNDDDILGEFEWKQTRGLDQTYNVVRGRYVDPSDNALYQMVDYPEVAITSLDGIERVMALDLPYVEDGKRAQRIAKQALQRNQYGGTFRAVFKAKAYGANVGEVVRLSFETLGWTNKLFRVISKEVGFDGTCPMELIEENAAIYAWDAEESPPVSPPAPTVYNPLNDPFIQAIDDIAAIADGKISSFYQASAPTAEGIGDIWFDTDDGNKMYRWNGTSWVVAQDTAITQAISDAATAQATADGKIATFYRTSSPTAEGVGDLWFDTDDGNRVYRWSGSAWVSAQDDGIATALSDAATAQATADGKVTTFYQTSAPTAEGVGDLWVDTDDGNKLYRWSGSAWVSIRDSGIAQAITDAATAQATADGKVQTFYQATPPTAEGVGDLWIDTDDSNKLYRWSGSAWVAVDDARISAALSDAATAQATADGKIATFYQTSSPTAEGVGDLWVDTDDNNKLYRWSGSAWVNVRDNGAAYALIGLGSDGTVNEDKVTTISIQPEAVTTKTYSFTSGSVNIPSGGYTYVQVQTATITSTGEDVEIDGYFELDVIDNCKYQYRFIRGTTTLITLGPITVNTSDGPPAFFRYVDSPTAGTYTYKVEVACNDANNINVLNRGLSLKEIKR